MESLVGRLGAAIWYLVGLDATRSVTERRYVMSFLLSPPCPVCKAAKADLVFLVDGSWSIGDDNFLKIIRFLYSTTGALDQIGPDGTQVPARGRAGCCLEQTNAEEAHFDLIHNTDTDQIRPDVLPGLSGLTLSDSSSVFMAAGQQRRAETKREKKTKRLKELKTN